MTLNFYLYPDTSGATKQAISNCNAQSGGKYTISYQKLPQASDGQRQQLVRRLAAHDPSMDIIGLDVTWEPEFAEAGWIVPWTGTYKAQAEDGTLKPALQTATWKGQLVAVPDNTNTQLLWYRSDLVPNPPTTWAQMIADAEQLAKEGKPHYIEIQGAQYEGATVWFNTMVTSAGGSILNASASGAVPGRARRQGPVDHEAARRLAGRRPVAVGPDGEPEPARDGGGHRRLRAELPVRLSVDEDGQPEAVQETSSGRRTRRSRPGVPAKVTIGGIDLAVSAYSQHKDLAFQAALCLRDEQNQLIGANVGGVPPTIASLYNDPTLFADYPFHADILSALAERERPPADPGLPGGLHRPLAPDLAADQDQPGRPPSSRWSARSTTLSRPRAWSREPKEDPMSTIVPATGTTATPAHAKPKKGAGPAVGRRQAGAPPRVLAHRPRGPRDDRGDRLPAGLRGHPVP